MKNELRKKDKRRRNWASHLKGLLAFYRCLNEIFIIQTRLSADLYANIAIFRSFFFNSSTSFNVYQFEYVWKRNLCGKIMVADACAVSPLPSSLSGGACLFWCSALSIVRQFKWKINWDAAQHFVPCETMQNMEMNGEKKNEFHRRTNERGIHSATTPLPPTTSDND